jgi:hypothetical protein
LSIGADYNLRGVSITPQEKSQPGLDYYDPRLQAYMIADLSQDVEATVRIQSITPWGAETSSSTLATRYPNANGTPWVQNAFVRLPRLLNDKVVVTVGRQPIIWGDGHILSDDQLGFNAVRVQAKSPFRWVDFDIEGFTAKISDGLQSGDDTDLHGAMLGFNRDVVRWEVMSLWEKKRPVAGLSTGS